VTLAPIPDTDRVNLYGLDITERKRAEEELRLHATIMDNVAEGIYLIGLDDLMIKWANERFARMFGYEPGEMDGKRVEVVNAPTDRTPAETRISIVDILKEAGEWHGEVKNIKRDGTHFWCYANVSLFDHPEYGKVIVSVHTDITERKRAEGALRSSLREKEVLLREVHHRVKNNLQVLNSLLRLQARQVDDERLLDVLTDSQNRIKAMALVHEALYRTEDVAHVDCGAYIRTLAHELYRAYGADAGGVTFHLTGEDIVLSIDKAVPCGQILTELISNSLKHAFPQGWKGQRRIDVRLANLEGGQIELAVSDNGVGMPAEVEAGDSHFLGLHLVKMLAEDQLGASIETYTENGTRFEIKFVGG